MYLKFWEVIGDVRREDLYLFERWENIVSYFLKVL